LPFFVVSDSFLFKLSFLTFSLVDWDFVNREFGFMIFVLDLSSIR